MSKLEPNAFALIEKIKAEFAGASDRAAAIVGGAFVGELLRELLLGALTEAAPSRDKSLFEGTSGILATFSARIEMSWRLGLISTFEYRTLNVIRGIRNEFAHELGEISFLSQSVKDRCASIAVPEHVVPPSHVPLSERGEEPPPPTIKIADRNDARAVFQEAIITLTTALGARYAMASRQQRTVPADFKELHEPDEVWLNTLIEGQTRLREATARLDAQRKEIEALRARASELDPNAKFDPDTTDTDTRDAEKDAEADKRLDLFIRLQRFMVYQLKRAIRSK